jgi:hypothetical protein
MSTRGEHAGDGEDGGADAERQGVSVGLRDRRAHPVTDLVAGVPERARATSAPWSRCSIPTSCCGSTLMSFTVAEGKITAIAGIADPGRVRVITRPFGKK